MTSEDMMRAYLAMIESARDVVRMHAQEYTPHVDPATVRALVRLVGDQLSIDAALDELDKLEGRAAVEH